MSQVAGLFALQTHDDEATALRISLASVENRLQGDEALNQARQILATLDADLEAARKEQRTNEAEIAALTAKIDPEEKRLYSGTVTNPKELGNIQHELELLRRRRSGFEDTLLTVLDRIEALSAERESAATALAAHEARWAEAHEQLTLESRRLNENIARADARRESLKGAVDPKNLTLYESLRRRKGGSAVARLTGSTCQGCRVTVPDAIRRRAFSPDAIAQCPNCERILSAGG